jgi:LysM repeat protein
MRKALINEPSGPFCQISTTPSSLPQGLRDPPSYTASSSKDPSRPPNPPSYSDELPSYSSLNTNQQQPQEKPASQPAEDVLHFLNHSTDTLPSLSLRYNVPLSALRKANNLTSDHLLLARRTLLIPGEYYKVGVSLSPRPIEGEEEEHRKSIIRKWMVRCKVAEYDVALLYLEQAGYDLEMAVGVYEDDERWERENPLKGKEKGKVRDGGRRRFTGQRS